MSKLIIGIGIPGSGKTSYLKKLLNKSEFVYISPDEIREFVTGNIQDQSRDKEVWARARKELLSALGKKQDVIFDATFVERRYRKELIDLARKSGADIVEGVFADVGLDVARGRNLQRGRAVPDEVLVSMYNRLRKTPPEKEEGFDELYILDEKGEIRKYGVTE